MSTAVTAVIIMALAMSPAIIGITGGLLLGHRKQVLKMRMAGTSDPQQVRALLDTAQRMEQRIGYLERVLDNEAPGWRGRSETL
jgi:phage shock protein B